MELAKALGGHLPPKGRRIGLLGGSFNPAHEGHLRISLRALKSLDLDEVWWLVSPRNPLKSGREMATLEKRHRYAKRFCAPYSAIRVTTLENTLSTQFTLDSLRALHALFPAVRFAWLMGEDNLMQMDRWQGWQEIFTIAPIAIFSRPAYPAAASLSKAALFYRTRRLPERRSRALMATERPCWTLVHGELLHQSSTRLRAERPCWVWPVES